MLESNDLKEIEEGYFVYKGETEKTADDPIKVHEISSDPKKTIQSYEPPVKSDTVPSGVKLKLNGRNEDAFDISDALFCKFYLKTHLFVYIKPFFLSFFHIFALLYGRNAIFARHIETTKRYAFLVIGNVRNFQSQQESVAVRAYSVDWLLHLLTR